VITYYEADPIARGEEQRAYEKFVANADLHGVPVRPLFVESDDVAEAIHRAAQEHAADLKVMATRGRSRSAAILLGSVAEGVIVEARTPLLIVKRFGAKLSLLETLLDRAFRRESPHFN
jgi:nucleotide-binding universal stress UspA family protein